MKGFGGQIIAYYCLNRQDSQQNGSKISQKGRF